MHCTTLGLTWQVPLATPHTYSVDTAIANKARARAGARAKSAPRERGRPRRHHSELLHRQTTSGVHGAGYPKCEATIMPWAALASKPAATPCRLPRPSRDDSIAIGLEPGLVPAVTSTTSVGTTSCRRGPRTTRTTAGLGAGTGAMGT